MAGVAVCIGHAGRDRGELDRTAAAAGADRGAFGRPARGHAHGIAEVAVAVVGDGDPGFLRACARRNRRGQQCAQRQETHAHFATFLSRKAPTRRIDSSRNCGPRQSFCTSMLGARAAISALVCAGCGLSVPGCRKSGVRQFLTKSRVTENTKSEPNMLWPKESIVSWVIDGSRARTVSLKPLTAAFQVSRFSHKPIGFCSTAAVTRPGSCSIASRQKLPPMQPPMTANFWKPR